MIKTALTTPSNSLSVFRYATMRPMQTVERKTRRESIFSYFFFYFPGNHSACRFDQNVGPAGNTDDSDYCVNAHQSPPDSVLHSEINSVKQKGRIRQCILQSKSVLFYKI